MRCTVLIRLPSGSLWTRVSRKAMVLSKRIPCGGCNKVYVGETGRPIGKRIKEHKRDVRFSRVEGSAVAEHA